MARAVERRVVPRRAQLTALASTSSDRSPSVVGSSPERAKDSVVVCAAMLPRARHWHIDETEFMSDPLAQ
jgi:hypothetical protein